MNSNFYKKSLNLTFVNNKQKTNKVLFVFGMFSIAMFFVIAQTSESFAETSIETHLDDELLLQKTTTILNVPQDNVLPWATVKGTVDNPAQGYPVIIQFFSEESGDEPMHVAQVDVKGDDTYEYKFRVRNMNLETGEAINIFEGDYTVKIFKVLNASHEELDSV